MNHTILKETIMIQRAPGVEDIFPDTIEQWNRVLRTARDAFRRYNYREIVIPVMEFTEVFSRGIGDDTDIVSKEMFTFEDRGGRSLTLRPEGTASVVRAYTGNGEYNRLSLSKFFYAGPMFRAERPQKGRLRQFTQFGAELFGSDDPWHDFEIMAVMDDISRSLDIKGYELRVNSIGCEKDREAYRQALRQYYADRKASLCEDCQKRYDTNVLRLLDCKKESCQPHKQEAPVITEYLCEECALHYSEVKDHLKAASISFREDPFLVRGLDYYTKTTFEFVTTALGGQNAFAAGGRYNGLVETFGGSPTAAVGFAAGVERILLLLEDQETALYPLDAYIIHSGDGARDAAMALTRHLRSHNISCDLDPGGKGFKSQFKRADREGARFALIIGEEELQKETITVKDLVSGTQETVPRAEIATMILSKD